MPYVNRCSIRILCFLEDDDKLEYKQYVARLLIDRNSSNVGRSKKCESNWNSVSITTNSRQQLKQKFNSTALGLYYGFLCLFAPRKTYRYKYNAKTPKREFLEILEIFVDRADFFI